MERCEVQTEGIDDPLIGRPNTVDPFDPVPLPVDAALDRLRGRCRAAFFVPDNPVVGGVELEFETHPETVFAMVDQRIRILGSAAVLGEQAVGHRVEHGGLADAVRPAEHPERLVVRKADLGLGAEAQKVFDGHALGDHAVLDSVK